MPAPSRVVLHQTNQVFLDDSRDSRTADARLAAQRISAAAAVGAVAGVRAAMTEEKPQVSSETVAKTVAAAASEGAAAAKAVVVTVDSPAAAQTAAHAAAAAPPDGRTARVCNPKVPAVIVEPEPNPCEWWGTMHQKHVDQIQVRLMFSTSRSCPGQLQLKVAVSFSRLSSRVPLHTPVP